MYESVKRKGATSPTVLPQWAVPTPVESLPKLTEVVQRALTAHTFRPVLVQRRATQPVLQASQYEQREVQRSATEQATVQRQLDVLPPLLPGALSAALQRQQAPARPPFKPQSPAEWVAVMRFQAEQAEGRLMDVHQAGQFTALQRQVAQVLQQGYRQDRQPPAVRQAHYAEHLLALQRHPASSQVARAVMALIPAGERPALQRAVDEALQRQALQDAQDQAALTQQTLQRKKVELEAEALQPVLQRIQARRGAGNPLPAAIQRHLEQGLNHDLSRVRIHDDAEADKLSKKVNALAFTTGTDIYFRSGQFNPNTQSGLELLAHEVTHTVQQSKGNVGTGVDPDAGLESEARQMGQKLATLPVKQAPNPHAPGVYTHAAALTRVQAGAAQALSLKPLTDLQPQAVQRLGNPLTWVADQAKSGLASALTAIPGYRELTMAFGKDLVTGKTMAANPNAILDALAGWVPGPLKDVLKALKETGAIPKAWVWFKAELSKLDLGGALGEVGKAIGKADLGAAKTAITRRISGLKALIVGSAHKIAEIGLMALTAGLGPVGQQVIAKLRGSGDLILQVLKSPAKFASHLLGALKGGFSRFAQNAPKHLQNGLGQWLTGASGIAFPAKLDLQGVFLTALSVMGLTYQAMRGRLVKSLGANGEKQVRQAEGTLDTLKTLKGGLHKASEMKANQGSVSSEVTSNLKTEVTKSVVMAGITKVATMLIPGGGFVNALIGAFHSVQFLVQQGQQIMGVVTSAIASVSAIAAGNIGAAITGVESTLARSIPVALGFLGKLLGLGNLGAKIKAVINKVRGQLDRVLDRVVARIGTLIAKLSPARKTGVPATPTAVADRKADHDQRVAKGLADLSRIESSFAQNGRLPNQQAARLVAQAVKGRHTIFKSVTPRFEQDKVSYDWVASAGTHPGRLPLAVLTLNVEGIRKEFWNKAGRPGWQVATKVKMAQQYPQHHLQVAGVTLPTLKAGYDRRHIDAFDQTVTRLASQLNHMTFDEAKALLTARGFAPTASTDSAIRAALKKYLQAEFNQVDNLFVDEAAENQQKGRLMEAAEQRRNTALRAGNQATADREVQQIAVQAVDVPRGQPNGARLTQASRASLQLLQSFRATSYVSLRGHIISVKAGTASAPLQQLWEDAQTELDAVRLNMALLAKFSKSGDPTANATIEAALVQATAQLRIVADILDGR